MKRFKMDNELAKELAEKFGGEYEGAERAKFDGKYTEAKLARKLGFPVKINIGGSGGQYFLTEDRNKRIDITIIHGMDIAVIHAMSR